VASGRGGRVSISVFFMPRPMSWEFLAKVDVIFDDSSTRRGNDELDETRDARDDRRRHERNYLHQSQQHT